MKKLFLALLVVMIGGTLGVGIAYAYEHSLLNKWGNAYQTCTFQVQSTFGSLSKTQFADACGHWNNQLTKKFLYKSSSDTTIGFPDADGTKTVTKAYYGWTTWVARAIPYNNASGEVKEVDIELNTYHPFANSKLSGYYDVQSIFTHELGHALRVGDSPIYDDTMYQTAKINNDDNRTVTAADRDAARASTARWFQ